MAAPERMCRVCRKHQPKAELRRWIILDGQLVADPAQRLPGRGYYTCGTERCQEILPKTLSKFLASKA